MNKKLLLASVVIVPIFAVGGFWIYQASRFDDSLKQQLALMQDTLKAQGVSFTYDEIKVSKLSFTAHLTNPKITGILPQLSEDVKNVKGSALVEGEIIACFSPLANSVSVKQVGVSHFKAEGPIELDVSFPRTSNSNIIVKRKEYDFFGKNPFLSFKNLERIESKIHGGSIFVNGQKLLDLKDAYADIFVKQKVNDLEIAFNSDLQKVKFYNVENVLKGTLEGLDKINAQLNTEILPYVALGEQNQKMSFSFHVNDFEKYVENILSLVSDKTTAEVGDLKFFENLNKLFPEGIRFELKDFSTVNPVYTSSVKVSFERTTDQYLLSISGDSTVGNEWGNYWKSCEKKLLQDLDNISFSSETMSIIKGDTFFKDIMPQLQTFGQMKGSLNLEAPTSLALGAGKFTLQFKSDLYDIAAKGSLNEGGVSVEVATRNAMALASDLENYVTKIADKFLTTSPQEVASVKSYLKGGTLVLDKVLVPQGTSEQQVDIKASMAGITVGKHDLAEIMTLFNTEVTPTEPEKVG